MTTFNAPKTKEEIINSLKKARSLSEAAFLILGFRTKGKRHYFHTKRFAKQYAYTYNQYFKERLSSYDHIINLFLNKTSFRKNPGNILDFGCGSALLLICLAKKIFKNKKFQHIFLYGADNSEIMINLGKQNIRENNLSNKIKTFLIKKNLKELNLQEIKYIVSTSAFHLIKNPEKVITEMLDHLPKCGEIFIQDIRRDSPWELKRKRLIHLASTLNKKDFIDGLKGHLSALSVSDIKNILEKLKNKYKLVYKIYSIKRKKYYDLTLGVVIKKL